LFSLSNSKQAVSAVISARRQTTCVDENVAMEEDDKEDTDASSDDGDGDVGIAAASFSQMGLHAALVKALTARGLTEPRHVQSTALPHIISGDNAMVQARAGRGKTLIYLIAALQSLLTHGNGSYDASDPVRTRVVILVNSKLLARQVYDEIYAFGELLRDELGDMKVVDSFTGDEPANDQVRRLLHGVPAIVVATPGRLMDLLLRDHAGMKRKGRQYDPPKLPLGGLSLFVVDECDCIIGESSQRRQFDVIHGDVGSSCQKLFFSAMYGTYVRREVRHYCLRMNDTAVEVFIDEHQLIECDMRQEYLLVPDEDRLAQLQHDLGPNGSVRFRKAIVFANSAKRTEWLALALRTSGMDVCRVDSRMSTEEIRKEFNAFVTGRGEGSRIMVTTDVLARGMDVAEVDLVIVYDVPMAKTKRALFTADIALRSSVEFMARIGRTGRTGQGGGDGDGGRTRTYVHSEEDFEIMDLVQQRFKDRIRLVPGIRDDPTHVDFCEFEVANN
jgi:superfamily II DNA/RNA helicase